MKLLMSARVGLVLVVGMLMACASSRQEASKAPQSDDLLELLTGFGESLSKRNFTKAVDYMVPEEKAMMMEGSQVSADKQKMLLALPLQRLIRHPAIRVENGKIAGIYTLLPNLNQGQAPSLSSEDVPADDSSPTDETSTAEATDLPIEEDSDEATTGTANSTDPRLKDTVNKFFSAVSRRNWSSALALMNDGERKLLLDDKGRIKESSKQRLSQMDTKNKDALLLQDGKLTGVTLLLPSE